MGIGGIGTLAARPMARRDLLRVRLDRYELAAVDQLAATRGGLTRSDLIRQLVAEASPEPPPAPSLGELLAPFGERGPPAHLIGNRAVRM
jgi:hypothetical protein